MAVSRAIETIPPHKQKRKAVPFPPGITSVDDAREFERLYSELTAAQNRAFVVLKAMGSASAEFEKADQKVIGLWQTLRRLQGDGDSGPAEE